MDSVCGRGGRFRSLFLVGQLFNAVSDQLVRTKEEYFAWSLCRGRCKSLLGSPAAQPREMIRIKRLF